jgi:hypothetical protein
VVRDPSREEHVLKWEAKMRVSLVSIVKVEVEADDEAGAAKIAEDLVFDGTAFGGVAGVGGSGTMVTDVAMHSIEERSKPCRTNGLVGTNG